MGNHETSTRIVQSLNLIKGKEEPSINDDQDDVFEELLQSHGRNYLYLEDSANDREIEKRFKHSTENLNSDSNYTIEYNGNVILLEKIKQKEPDFEEEVNVNDFLYNLDKELNSSVDAKTEDKSVIKVKPQPLALDVNVKKESVVEDDDKLSISKIPTQEKIDTIEHLKGIKKEDMEFEEKVNLNDFIINFDNGFEENVDIENDAKIDLNEFNVKFNGEPGSDVDVETVDENSAKLMSESSSSEVYAKEETAVKHGQNRSFRNIKKLEDSNKNIEWYYCAKCTYRAKKKRHIRLHVLTHSNEELKRFSCEFCSKKYGQKQKLACHVLSKHRNRVANGNAVLKNRKFHHCTLCDYTTLMQCDLKKHLFSHGDTSDAVKLSCKQCDFSTYNKSNFSSHLRVHSNYRQFICTACSKGFNRKSGLDGHILQKHKSDKELLGTITSKLYECSFCSLKFIKTTHLDSHLKGRHTLKGRTIN